MPTKQISIPTITCLLLFLGILYLGTSWLRPLSNPDEGRYTEIPREMVVTGDWTTPRLNGILYFYKPPLFYWLEALSIKIGGLYLFTLRVPNALLAIMGCLFTYLTGTKLYSKRTGIFSALVLGTSLLYFGMGQIITMDMAVSVFITGALFCFIVGVKEKPSYKKSLLCYGFFLFLSLGVLTKGLIGIVIPGLIIFLWLLLCNQWKKCSNFPLWKGFFLFAILTIPWHLLAAIATPAREGCSLFSTNPTGQGFLWYYLIHEHILRYLNVASADRYHPFWFFFVVLPLGFFPWIFFLPQAIWKECKKSSGSLFFLLWPTVVLLFFSFSKSKLIPYILPAYPALALLTGHYIALLWDNIPCRKFCIALMSYGIGSILLSFSIPIVLFKRAGKISPEALPWFAILIMIAVFGGILTFALAKRNHPRKAAVTMLSSTFLSLLLMNPIGNYSQHPSTQSLAHFLKSRITETTPVFTLYDYHQDFPVYLNQTIGVGLHTPNEQKFGLSLEDHSNRYLKEDNFFKTIKGKKRIYALTKADSYFTLAKKHPELPLFLIKANPDFVLFSNQPNLK